MKLFLDKMKVLENRDEFMHSPIQLSYPSLTYTNGEEAAKSSS